MCRWLSYRGEPIFLEDLIAVPNNALIRQSLQARQAVTVTNGDGFGVAWYDTRPEPGLFRDILPAWNDPNLRHLAHQVRSSLFMAHVRASTGTATSRANCHPFNVGPWAFMHNGQIGGYSQLRRRLEALIDDNHYAHRVGSTDSELIFLLLLQNDFAARPLKALAQTIAIIEKEMDAIATSEPLRFTACMTDGSTLIAWRYANDDRPPSLFCRQSETGTVVASEPLDDLDDSWIALEPGQVVTINEEVGFAQLNP